MDSIGIGHNFGLYLRKKGFPVELVNVGLPCESRPELRENNPAERFTNLKALYYQSLADDFERGEISGLTDETTTAQLIGIRGEIDGKGRTKIESKKELRARGEPSPDRAEALMLALGKPTPEYAFYAVDSQAQQRTAGKPMRPGDVGYSPEDYQHDMREAARKRTEVGRLSQSQRWKGSGLW